MFPGSTRKDHTQGWLTPTLMRFDASSVAQGSFAQSLNQLFGLFQSFCGGISQASLDLLLFG